MLSCAVLFFSLTFFSLLNFALLKGNPCAKGKRKRGACANSLIRNEVFSKNPIWWDFETDRVEQ